MTGCNLRLPSSQAKRAELMVAYGRDGYHLLDQVYSASAPVWLRELPAVQVLRRVWIQQLYRTTSSTTAGVVTCRTWSRTWPPPSRPSPTWR